MLADLLSLPWYVIASIVAVIWTLALLFVLGLCRSAAAGDAQREVGRSYTDAELRAAFGLDATDATS